MKKSTTTTAAKCMNWRTGSGRDPSKLDAEPRLVIPKPVIVEAPSEKPMSRKKFESAFGQSYLVYAGVVPLLRVSANSADDLVHAIDKRGRHLLMPEFVNSKGRRRSGGSHQGGTFSRPLPQSITVDLDYPLSKTARVTVVPYVIRDRRGVGPRMSVGYMLWQFAQAYKMIYSDPERWGIWGHSINDLVFERLWVNQDQTIGHVGVGS